MTTIVKDDGKIAENVVSSNEPNALSEVYSLVPRDHKNVAYAISDETDDPDSEKWAEYLNNIQFEGHSLGAIQGKAVEGRLATYIERFGYSEVPTEQPNEWESEFLESKDILENVRSDSTWWESPEDVRIPLTADGERLPLVVTTNDYSEATSTFDEAKELLLGVLERIEGLNVGEVDDATEEAASNKNKKSSSDSDDDDMSPEGQIHGVGDSVASKVEDSFYEFVPSRFPNEDEWDSSIEESDYYVEEEWESPNEKRKVLGESDDSSTPELTTGDLLDRASEVEVPEAEQKLFYQRLENDKLYDAESILSRHE